MTYYFRPSNTRIALMVIEAAKAKGLSVCENYEGSLKHSGIASYATMCYEPNRIGGNIIWGRGSLIDDVNITLEELLNSIEGYKPDSLKLTSDYTAYVNRDRKIVKVGCQDIPFRKVEELYNLIKD